MGRTLKSSQPYLNRLSFSSRLFDTITCQNLIRRVCKTMDDVFMAEYGETLYTWVLYRRCIRKMSDEFLVASFSSNGTRAQWSDFVDRNATEQNATYSDIFVSINIEVLRTLNTSGHLITVYKSLERRSPSPFPFIDRAILILSFHD